MFRKQTFTGLAAAALLAGALPSVSWADSITPSSFSATLEEGESVTIRKTVTVSAGTPVSSKVDVVFLADQTGSMFGAINAVKAAASAILSATASLGDVQFGVGGYNGELGGASFNLHQNLTSNQATAQAGINAWFASGGGDFPEANLYGLSHVANDMNWRAGSERIVVWFGDAPGHDPSPAGSTPPDGKVTEAQATAALLAKGINVQAVNVGALDSTGQATRITNATGGNLYNGINTSTIVATIQAAITSVVANYSSVGIDTSEVPAGVSVSVNPLSHVGAFDRSVERTFDFDVTFTGDTAGTYDFSLYGTVDGGRVATEVDRIIVTETSGPGVPDAGSTLTILGLALLGLGGLKRKFSR